MWGLGAWGTSLVIQWLGICHQVRETWDQSLVGELRAYVLWDGSTHGQQLLSLRALEAVHHNEDLMQLNFFN